jgi:hypothetical protein
LSRTNIVLIDAGENGRGKSIVWPYLKNSIAALVGKPGVSFVIVSSHLHSDHIGGMDEVLDSIRLNWGTAVVTAVVDRSIAGSYLPPPGGGIECYDPEVDLPSSGVFNAYNKAADYFVGKRYNLNLTSDLFKSTGSPLSGLFSMCCVASNGFVAQATNVINGSPRNENDLSYAFIIRFGKFKYFTGGDLGGGGTNYTDMETPLCTSTYVDSLLSSTTVAHVCALKINHHGSNHSSNAAFLAKFRPSMGVFEAGVRKFNGKILPTAAFYTTLQRSIPSLPFTYTLKPRIPYPGTDSKQILNYQDLVITVTNPNGNADGTLSWAYTVIVKGARSPYAQVSTNTTSFNCNKQH